MDPVSHELEEPLDRFVSELQQLRQAKGTSFGALAIQVSNLRLARGLHEAAARTPRSTVYSCFCTGRARIDTELLRDIVFALTEDESEKERWVNRYLAAHKQSEDLRQKR